MPRLSAHCVNQIRLRADIVALAGAYTSLKKQGARWVGLSPFKTEKTPSFSVDENKQLFYCFSSGQGGDSFKLVMLKEGLTFPEALEYVACRFGVPLEYEPGHGAQPGDRMIRGKLLELHEVTALHFHTLFKSDQPLAATARAYWTNQRAFGLDVAEDYKIGFAPPDGGDLASLLLSKGFEKSTLAASGLFCKIDHATDPRRWRPRFRGRLMIPLRDIQGRIVAFSARQLPGITPTDDPTQEAKYLNSPETDIFKKSHLLFNLDLAKDHAKSRGSIVLVEGPLDAIRCRLNGIPHVVATQGTSIGDTQIALLARYTTRVDALLDADEPGQKAQLRLLAATLKGQLDMRCLSLPGAQDPDEFLSANGPEGWLKIEATATDAMEFAVRKLIPPGLAPAAKMQAVKEVFSIIAHAKSAIIRASSLDTLAHTAGLSRTSVMQDYQRFHDNQL